MELDHFNNFGSGMRMLDKITMVFNSGAENIKIAQFDIHTKNIYLKD
ncbi:TPA: hypothetical protein VBN14_001862, partial [Streptococcus agalactiae]|nr:hypothetical protein [Streptococcus agalactiae]